MYVFCCKKGLFRKAIINQVALLVQYMYVYVFLLCFGYSILMWCVNYSAIFSQNCWVAALCLYVRQSVRTIISVNSFTIEVNSKITTSSLFAHCWLARKNKLGNLAQCKTEKYFQGIILIFTTISTLFGSNYTSPTRQIALRSTLLITYTSDFVTPA